MDGKKSKGKLRSSFRYPFPAILSHWVQLIEGFLSYLFSSALEYTKTFFKYIPVPWNCTSMERNFPMLRDDERTKLSFPNSTSLKKMLKHTEQIVYMYTLPKIIATKEGFLMRQSAPACAKGQFKSIKYVVPISLNDVESIWTASNSLKTSNTSQQGFIYDALQLTMLDEFWPTCKMFKNELKTLLRALLHVQFSSQWFFSQSCLFN